MGGVEHPKEIQSQGRVNPPSACKPISLKWLLEHNDLETFGPSEHNTLHPLKMYCS
jgi:hypothetical protein